MDDNVTAAAMSTTEEYEDATSITSLVMGCLGLLGNALCARMMFTSPMKPYSSGLFLIFAAFSDSVVLLFEVMNDALIQMGKYGYSYTRDEVLFGGDPWRCRVGVFAYEVARLVSAWAVVAMAAELTIVAGSPGKQKSIYSRKRSFYISMAVCLIGVAGCFPFLVIVRGAGAGTNDEGVITNVVVGDPAGCGSKYAVFMEVYSHVVLHMCVNSLLPLIFIAVCSAHSIYRINKRSSGGDQHQRDGRDGPSATAPEELQLPWAILAVSVIYALSVLPRVLIDLAYFLKRLVPELQLLQPQWNHGYIVAQCIFLVNFASKFYIVLLLEPQLRKGLSHIFSCGFLKSRIGGPQSKYLANEYNSKNQR